MRVDTQPAGRFPEDRHPIAVAPKRTDIPLHPLERELLIQKPIVTGEMAFCIKRRMREEAEIGPEEAV
jgi:hypothetical protein